MTDTLSPEVRAQLSAWARRADAPRAATCAHCGAAYTALRAWSKYCGNRCAVAAHRRAKREAQEGGTA